MFIRRIQVLLPLAVASVMALPTGVAVAQTTTQGAIAGTVLDVTGAIVPKAHLTIKNQGTNAVIKVDGDDSGFFKAPLLEPGTYTVNVTAAGFGGDQIQVVVQVGQTTNLSPRLNAGSTEQQVQVSADVPLVNTESPDFSSNINETTLANLPINNRRWSSLALFTPGVTLDSSGFGLISVRGISTILNNIEIDGADDNQAYFSEERGRTREAYSTSGSAVREFQVNTGVYAAEYGRAAGGVVNSVTKSGTNSIHGEAYFYDRESKWNAYNDQSTIPVVGSTGTVTNVPFKPKDLRKIYGFSAGGPLIKDKLFWFYTYDQHSRLFPLSGVATNPSSVNNTSSYGFNAQPDALLPAGSNCDLTTGYMATPTTGNVIDAQVCTLAARLKLGTYAAGASLYTADLAALNSDLGLIPRFGDQEINTPKLDYQINPKEHVEFLYHRLRWDSPGGVQTNATGDYSFDSAGTDFVKLDYGVAKLTSLLRSNLSNEILYQYSRELNDEGQQPLSAYSKNVLQQADGNIPYVTLDTSIGAFFGSPYYSYRPKYPDERKWQIGDSLFLTKGNNSIKFGVDTVHNYDLTNQAQYYEGNYIYTANLANYFADLNAKGTGVCDVAQQSSAAIKSGVIQTAIGVYPCYNSYQQGFGPTTFDFATEDLGFFAQDNYKFNPRLTLELGLRYDYEITPAPLTSLTTATGSFVPYNGIANNPHDRNNFGPRIGFAYDTFGNGRTVVRGGFGMYYGRITNGNLGTILATTGSPLAQTTPTVKASLGLATEPYFGSRFSASQLSSSAKPAGFFRAPNLQNPQVMEFDLQVQQEFGHQTFAQVSYLGALGRELPNFLNVNLNPATATSDTLTISDSTGTGPLPNGTVINIPTVYNGYGNTALLGPSATNFTSITEYISNVNSSYNAFVAEVQNRSLKSLQFDVNYTWAHALDYSQNSSTATSTNTWYDPFGNPRANYGNSTYNTPNRLNGYVLYNFPGVATQHSLLSYVTNDWSLSDGFQYQTGSPYSYTLSGSVSTAAVSSGLNGAGGQSYIPQLGHNNLYFKRVLIDDLRVEKQFAITDRAHLQIFLQAFNVANHQNWSSVNSTAYKLTGVNGTSSTGVYQANFGTVSKTNNSGFSLTPRQLELSGRLFF
jgi:outer membrane receptor protein involved in Fe transport